jgi:CubicO group peptidase (beta-lactamase class C family)
VALADGEPTNALELNGTRISHLWEGSQVPDTVPFAVDGGLTAGNAYRDGFIGTSFCVAELPSGMRAGQIPLHRSASVDYMAILRGRIVMVLPDRCIELGQGDTVVQGGADHSWDNPFEETCLLLFVVVPAVDSSVRSTALVPPLLELEERFAALVSRGQRAGVVWRVSRGGELLSAGAVGQRSDETVFRLYSMTRAITSVAALRLIEAGKLALADPLERYVPEFASPRVLRDPRSGSLETTPARRSIRILDLFSYTAGFGYAPDYPPALGLQRDDVLGLRLSTAEGIRHLARFPLLFQPGTRWHYGFSSDVLGRVIELVTGESLAQALRRLVCEPLGMRDTDFHAPVGRLAAAYGRRDGHLVEITAQVPKSADYERPGRLHSGGGGLVATAEDYWRFCEMLRRGGEAPNGRVLAAATVEAMLGNRMLPEQGPLFWHQSVRSPAMSGGGWGLGIGVRVAPVDDGTLRSPVGEAFWGGLAGTGFFIHRPSGVTAVVMTQYIGPDSDDPVVMMREAVHGAVLPSGGSV